MKPMRFPNPDVGRRRRRTCVALSMALVIVFSVFQSTAFSAAASKESPSLAIFPFHLPTVTKAYSDVFMDALYDVLEDTRKFIPKYSWYVGDDRFKPESLRQYMGSEDLSIRVWKQEEDRPEKGPDQKVVFEVGAQLGVDAVILYDFQVSGYGNDLVRGYLFDVTRKKVFTEERSGKMVYSFTGEILKSALRDWLHDITKALFRMGEGGTPSAH